MNTTLKQSLFLWVPFLLVLLSKQSLAQDVEQKKKTLSGFTLSQSCQDNTIVIPEGWILIACLDEDTLLTPIEYDYTWEILNPNRRFRFLVQGTNGQFVFADEDTYLETQPPFGNDAYSNDFDPALSHILENNFAQVNKITHKFSSLDNQHKFSIRLSFNSSFQSNTYWSVYSNETFIDSEQMEIFPMASNTIVMLLSRCDQESYDALFATYEGLSDQLMALEIARYQFYLQNGYFEGPIAYSEQEQAYWDWYFMTKADLENSIELLLQQINTIREQLNTLGCGTLGYS